MNSYVVIFNSGEKSYTIGLDCNLNKETAEQIAGELKRQGFQTWEVVAI